MPLLEAKGIVKVFGKLTALDGAALTVNENEFHGLIGPNGSGKSTLMKCVAGAEQPTEGRVRFADQDITALSPSERARAGMSLKFQITSVLPTLTLYDNILLALQGQSSLIDLLLSRSRDALHDQVMANLIGLLDEPTGGMSLEERRVTGELLQPIKAHCSLVIVEHDLDFIRDICDRLTVLDQGRVLESGTVPEIQASKSVQEIYLRRA